MHTHRLRFGSQDSIDEDVLYVFQSLPSFQECQAFCRQGEDNRNIVVVVDGAIAQSFKGIPDEASNALLATYDLHQQEFENPVTKKVVRNVLTKSVRATRVVLSMLSRSRYRPDIKPALRSNSQAARLKVLREIDFSSLDLGPEPCKSIAFQLGQSLALNQGHELYTKSEVKAFDPKLVSFLDRKSVSSLSPLNELRDRFLDSMRGINIQCDGSLNLFFAGSDSEATPCNLQANGIVIDLNPPEKCVAFPCSRSEERETSSDCLQETTLTVFRHDNQIRFASLDSLDNEVTANSAAIIDRSKLDKLDFDRYFFTVKTSSQTGGQIFLTGVRDRVTNKVLDSVTLNRLAVEAEISTSAD